MNHLFVSDRPLNESACRDLLRELYGESALDGRSLAQINAREAHCIYTHVIGGETWMLEYVWDTCTLVNIGVEDVPDDLRRSIVSNLREGARLKVHHDAARNEQSREQPKPPPRLLTTRELAVLLRRALHDTMTAGLALDIERAAAQLITTVRVERREEGDRP